MKTLYCLSKRSKLVYSHYLGVFVRRFYHHPPAILPIKPLVGQHKPILWLDDQFQNPHWLSDEFTLIFNPTVETLHQLIRESKFSTAHRVRCTLQDQGNDIPHNMIFLDAALGEINTLSSVTYHAFYGWLKLLPAKHVLNSGKRNPFRVFGSLYRSGRPSQDLEAILGMVKIASSKGYLLEELKRVLPLMTLLIKPTSGLALMLEFEKGYLDYITTVEPQNVQRHASLAREALILGCCEAKGRWMRTAMKLLKRSNQEGVSVSPEVANLVMMLKGNTIG
ncbi:hypothetical protein J3R30DRAFT_764100 [Lentinula aciculospora]|uniref:Uncharacterized protein n=1 Tax=Lentinula aciculospora TaxID=153920 RepID=A0A9W9A2R9_9AGAR|nr:hypothetical protein J3R30DRAFT_764100 [Lentinula aciculospora]